MEKMPQALDVALAGDVRSGSSEGPVAKRCEVEQRKRSH